MGAAFDSFDDSGFDAYLTTKHYARGGGGSMLLWTNEAIVVGTKEYRGFVELKDGVLTQIGEDPDDWNTGRDWQPGLGSYQNWFVHDDIGLAYVDEATYETEASNGVWKWDAKTKAWISAGQSGGPLLWNWGVLEHNGDVNIDYGPGIASLGCQVGTKFYVHCTDEAGPYGVAFDSFKALGESGDVYDPSAHFGMVNYNVATDSYEGEGADFWFPWDFFTADFMDTDGAGLVYFWIGGMYRGATPGNDFVTGFPNFGVPDNDLPDAHQMHHYNGDIYKAQVISGGLRILDGLNYVIIEVKQLFEGAQNGGINHMINMDLPSDPEGPLEGATVSHLVVCGQFGEIAGVEAYGVAMYTLEDGWRPFGDGLWHEVAGNQYGRVGCLQEGIDGLLYAGGDFNSTTNDDDCFNMAIWDGKVWTQAIPGMDYMINGAIGQMRKYAGDLSF